MTDQHSDDQLDAFGEWERAAWETRAAPYAASLGDLTCGSVPALLDAAGVGSGTRLLDVGTGPGFVALAAAARGAEVAAADQSTAMVDIARAAGVDAVVARADALPYDDASFDAVTAGYLVNHLARPQRALAELARVLRPGAAVAVTVWDLPEANPALGLFGPVAAALGLSVAVPPGPDAQRFSRDEAMLGLLEASLSEAIVQRVHWTVTVEPGAWFDAVATATPRTGAVLAAASDEQRAAMRERYVAVAREQYGAADGRVELPAGAVLGSARRS